MNIFNIKLLKKTAIMEISLGDVELLSFENSKKAQKRLKELYDYWKHLFIIDNVTLINDRYHKNGFTLESKDYFVEAIIEMTEIDLEEEDL